MGRGSRHSKNAGVMGSEALTYDERKALGFGTVKERLGKVRGGCRAREERAPKQQPQAAPQAPPPWATVQPPALSATKQCQPLTLCRTLWATITTAA